MAFCSGPQSRLAFSTEAARGPDGETAESRLYERDMPDILV
jgi:hypothetical protein